MAPGPSPDRAAASLSCAAHAVVILALPAYEAAKLVREIAPAATRALDAIDYAPVASVATAYRRERRAPFAGRLRLPRPEAGTTADPGLVVLEQHVRGTRADGHRVAHDVRRRPPQSRTCGQARRRARRDRARRARHRSSARAASRCGARSHAGRMPSRSTTSATWRDSDPSRTPSARMPGLFFCASYRGGVSVGDCIKSAHAMAETVRGFLGASPPRA